MRAEVVSSEFNSYPTEEGWQLVQEYCDPITWAEGGFYYQVLDFHACPPPPPPGGASQYWRRWINDLNGNPTLFWEARVETDGPASEIPGGAPTGVSVYNGYGILYHATVANDRVKLSRFPALPLVYVDVQPDTYHTVRLELRNGEVNTYRWYVDNDLVAEGEADGPFPVQDARMNFWGTANWEPCFNTWWYIRYGDIPLDASGDMTGDGEVDGTDFYFFAECVERSAAGEPAFPSCAWADFDSNGVVDCVDWIAFQDAWTDTENDPPAFPPCSTDPIPAVSDWGLAVLALLVLTMGTLTFRRTQPAAT